MKKKILLVFGTRPEAIKMIPLIKEFEKNKDLYDVKICVTAQHRELLDQVLSTFNINPDYDLNLMNNNQTLHKLTSRIVVKVTKVLEDFNPSIILVHGDTTTAMASSLAAYYKQIDIGHIEAGLRSFDLYSPWPEEGNRKIITQLAQYHFVPTQYCYNNLIKENIDKNDIYLVGNTIIDILSQSLKYIKKHNIPLNINIQKNKKIILATIHRREKSYNEILNIINALKKIVNRFNDVKIIIIVPENSKFKSLLKKIQVTKNIFISQSLDYYNMIILLQKSFLIISDSGGMQEESSYLGKPFLLVRNSTDRQEILNKNVKLVGTKEKGIFNQIELLLTNKMEYDNLCKKSIIYGNGSSSKKIVHILNKKK